MDIKVDLLPHQMRVFQSKSRVTSMSCAVGAGKSYIAALLTIIEMLRNKRVLLIAPTHDMIKDVLILQMREILNDLHIPYKHNKGTQELTLGSGMLFMKTNKSVETIRGLTKINTLIIDECNLIDQRALLYGKARMRGVQDPRIYLFGTGCAKSTFFAKESMKPDTTWIQADIWSNVKYNGREYIENLIKDYEDLPADFKQRELYGAFTDGSEYSLIDKIHLDVPFVDGPTTAGLDIAGTGADWSAIAVFKGNMLVYLDKRKTNEEAQLQAWRTTVNNMHKIDRWVHDASGIGNLFQWKDSTPLNFGAAAGTRFLNQRTRIYFDLKDKLAKGICFLNSEVRARWEKEAVLEIMMTKLAEKNSAKLQLIPKADIKKALGRSPDVADALALASIPFQASYLEQVDLFQYYNNPFRYNN